MTAGEWQKRIRSREGTDLLLPLYAGEVETATARVAALLEKLSPAAETYLFSSPGRTELGGNHTDHNHGTVLAAAVQLDALAAVTRREDMQVRLESRGYPSPFQVDISDRRPREEEHGCFEGIIRGVAARFTELGYTVGGFEGAIDSQVLPGSGLSSSAAVEVLLGTIFSHVYNAGKLAKLELAKIGQYAENRYFGKPCGLMDQTACATGGIVAIDFADPAKPRLDRIDYSFEKRGYLLAVVDTGGNHADLTCDYAACPEEMFAVARTLGRATAGELDMQQVLTAIPMLRDQTGDRAILRVIHFLKETHRAAGMIDALRTDNLPRYLALMRASGDSSWKLLQNCYSTQNPSEQGITLGIAAANELVEGNAAFRVHGGGFAGTMQALLPKAAYGEFRRGMESIFGLGCVTPLRLRAEGSMRLG